VVRAQNGETEEEDVYSDESELTVYKQQRDALYRKALEAGSKKIGKKFQHFFKSETKYPYKKDVIVGDS
jgi:hypothetical protein